MSSAGRVVGALFSAMFLLAGCSSESGDQGGCLDPRIDEANRNYIEQWAATSESLVKERCVLPGLHGPEPSTTASEGLGTELRLDPERLASDVDLPQSVLNPVVDYYPMIHVGEVGDTGRHAFLYWAQDRLGGPTPNIGGALADPGATMADQPGIWSIGFDENLTLGEIDNVEIYVVVPEEAAIAALAIDGQPHAWQRPVAKAAVFVINGSDLKSLPDSLTVTVYDQSGAETDIYREELS